jgi:hypothetical protein
MISVLRFSDNERFNMRLTLNERGRREKGRGADANKKGRNSLMQANPAFL